jgi:hypothetical protein
MCPEKKMVFLHAANNAFLSPSPRPLELKLKVTQRTLRTYKGRQHVVFTEWSQKNLFQGVPEQWQDVRRSNMNFHFMHLVPFYKEQHVVFPSKIS